MAKSATVVADGAEDTETVEVVKQTLVEVKQHGDVATLFAPSPDIVFGWQEAKVLSAGGDEVATVGL